MALGFDVHHGRPMPAISALVINIHHFIVDAYIWRLREDPNYRLVESAAA